MERKFNDQQLARRKKLDDLVAKGINPFGNAYTRTANSKSIKELLTGEVKPSVPASILKFHPNCILIADEEALSEL